MSDEHKLAQSPFDSEDADFILQTKDRVVFRVFKAILAQASPVLANTLSVPHPPVNAAQEEDYIDGIPVLRLEEESNILDLFLRICYPIVNPVLGLSDVYWVYRAGHKYDAAIVVNEARMRLCSFASDQATCLCAYAVACRLELEDLAYLAARTSLQLSFDQVIQAKFEGLELISGVNFVNLLNYHRRCQATITDDLLRPEYWLNLVSRTDEPFFQLHTEYSVKCCEDYPQTFLGVYDEWYDDGIAPPSRRTEYDVPYRVKCWMMEFLTDLRENVKSGRFPIRSAITDTQIVDCALEKAHKCEACRKTAFRNLTCYTQQIAAEADEEITSVPFNSDS